MKPSPCFLSIEQVKGVHRRVIREFGGDPAIRDEGLLESAVAMPKAMYRGNYLHPDVAAMAAAYLFHLCKNHPFVDGNKRTALVVTEVFLRLNGHRLAATARQLEQLTRGVADGSVTKAQAAEFFRRHVRD